MTPFLSSLCPQLKEDGKKGDEKDLQDFLLSVLHTTNTSSSFMKKKYRQKLQIHQGKTQCIRLTNRESGKKKVEDELSLFFLLYLPGSTLKSV